MILKSCNKNLDKAEIAIENILKTGVDIVTACKEITSSSNNSDLTEEDESDSEEDYYDEESGDSESDLQELLQASVYNSH